MHRAAASRYAKALADLTTQPSSPVDPQQLISELRVFEQAYNASTDLRAILTTPAVPPARKRAAIQAIGERISLSRIARNFLCVLIDHRRTSAIGEIVGLFENLLDERVGVVRAEVRTAVALGEPDRVSLVERLSSLTRKKVRPGFTVDNSLVGGAVARIGSVIYDGSVLGRLEALGRQLRAE